MRFSQFCPTLVRGPRGLSVPFRELPGGRHLSALAAHTALVSGVDGGRGFKPATGRQGDRA